MQPGMSLCFGATDNLYRGWIALLCGAWVTGMKSTWIRAAQYVLSFWLCFSETVPCGINDTQVHPAPFALSHGEMKQGFEYYKTGYS